MLSRVFIEIFLRTRVTPRQFKAASKRIRKVVDTHGMIQKPHFQYVIGNEKLFEELRDKYRQREEEYPKFLAALPIT